MRVERHGPIAVDPTVSHLLDVSTVTGALDDTLGYLVGTELLRTGVTYTPAGAGTAG